MFISVYSKSLWLEKEETTYQTLETNYVLVQGWDISYHYKGIADVNLQPLVLVFKKVKIMHT